MAWTKQDIKKYLEESMQIKYITINYLDTKYKVQIKKEN